MGTGISCKRIMAALENLDGGTRAFSMDEVRAAIAERDARGIGYVLTPAILSPKLAKTGGHVDVHAGVLYLRARTDGGRGNLCPAADIGCSGGCYGDGGRAALFSGINAGRQRKVDFLAENPAGFLAAVFGEAMALQHGTVPGGMTAVRLNGLSDIAWENRPAGAARNIQDALPAIRFWEYTRIPGRIAAMQRAGFPENLDITFSLGADNDRIAARALESGMKVAVVFRGAAHPASWHGHDVIDGDAHDFRFLESGPAIVALKAKGPARKDTSGWVREADSVGLDLARVPAFVRAHTR